MTRRQTLLPTIIFIIIVMISVMSNSVLHVSRADNGYNVLNIYPSNTMRGGESVLVLSDASHLTVTFNVSIILQGQGKETRYTWTDELVIEGLKWPYADNLYFYIIPGMPANDTIFTYSGTPYIVKVKSQATLTIYQVHETINKTITWAPIGDRNEEPIALLYVPDGDKYTLYLSPSGWTKPAGTDLQIMVVGYGFRGEPTASLFVGSGESYIQYSMEKYAPWWDSLGKIVDDLSQWFKSLEIRDDRLAGHLPEPEYSGGIWTATIPMKYKGSQIYYYGRVVDAQGGKAYTPKGTVIVTSSDGPRIVMIDDDLLLYLIGAENKEFTTKLLTVLPNSELLSEAYTLGDALLASGLIGKHYYDVLASMGQLEIAFPGNDTIEKLSSRATIVYISGFPPSIPDTILDWNSTSPQFITLLDNLTRQGTKIIITSTSLATIPYNNGNAYPQAITGINKTNIAALTGMKHLILAYDSLNNKVIAPLPGWSGTLYSTSNDPTIPHRVEVNSTVTVVGWQGIIPNCEPSINTDLLRSPWLTLFDKGITGIPLKTISDEASRVKDEILRTRYYLETSKVGGDKLVIYLENNTVSFPVEWLTEYLSDAAVPVMLSDDCMSGVFLFSPVYPRAVVFTFEPETDPLGGSVLINWALEKLLEPSIPPTKLNNIPLPLDVIHKANKLAQPGSEWSEGIIPGGGLVINSSSKKTVIVIPYGKIDVVEGRLLFQDLRGLIYKMEGERIIVVPRESYYILPMAIAPAKVTLTTTTTTTITTLTTTTTTTNTVTTTPYTNTTTGTVPVEGIDWRVIALITAAAVMAALAILYHRRRHPYKYI